ncbi:low molecular weight protein-tyrosine-phosphatase [Parabacteroides sp. PF5-9]|uniref:low molecular weight protein-tyrosine-phosphatase n=1 Tax=Parabacteroides sp. PF5-9 TaxID=1742404 RepID=UPI0024749F26|nr:low molecular weight protein-tyrosine-phosphatase [Parabacteroides sp. PF5-9]MDH6358437.1 protein-tyrosine phosphatase [Parabacteroides sp. PF5-9]
MKQEKIKLLFVCLGNICRSPSAEAVMKKVVKEAGLEDRFEIDSAGTAAYHEGEMADQRMRTHASRRGYQLESISRPVRMDDFDHFDLIIGMDDQNITNLKRLAPDLESQQKIHQMTEFSKVKTIDHVPDPYYGGASGFENVLDILEDACDGLLEQIKESLL